jgi:hypothetical protein
MKRYFVFMIALFVSAAVYGQQGVIKVQGHPHKSLTEKYGGKEDATTTRKVVPTILPDTAYIDPEDIECWIKESEELDPFGTDSAILIIKFTDRKTNLDSLYAWGFLWNHDTIHHGIDMLRTVVNNDKRLSLLLQYSGLYGHSIGGLGLNMYDDGTLCSRIDIDFSIANAQHDDPDSVLFSYFSPNKYCDEGQTAVPLSANNSTNQAITDYRQTGILVHPFGAAYGHAAYDFDFWYFSGYTPNVRHWQSGWVKNGFWGYYRADNWRLPIPNPSLYPPYDSPDAAEVGVTYEPLRTRQIHAFVFRPRIPLSKYDYQYEVHYFDGDIRFLDCGCAPCPQNVTSKKK